MPQDAPKETPGWTFKLMVSGVLEFFLSLRTSVVLLLGTIVFFTAGAVIMPLRAEFGRLNSVPLFTWLMDAPLGASWWLLGALGILGLLALNTLACSVESLITKRAGRQWLLIISPQIIHIGFLLMLLGHLVSASGGFKGNAMVQVGTSLKMPNGIVMTITALDVTLTERGFPTDWRADVIYTRDGRRVGTDYMGANRPSFIEEYGVYLKQIRPYPSKTAHIEVTREPGTPWALTGGAVFMLGTIVLVGLKMSREK